MAMAKRDTAYCMNGAEVLLNELARQKTEVVFGYPGGSVLPLYDALYDDTLQHVLARHEQGAVHMAEGYAKATGKPGVVIVTSGPGATNAITGIADAMSDSVPLIVFTGQVATTGIGTDAFQEADIIGLTMPITKSNYQVRAIEELPQIIQEAFHIATTGRKGPVVIDLPKDMTTTLLKQPAIYEVNLPGYQPNTVPNSLQIRRLLDSIKQAKRPVILAGGGIIAAEAEQELKQLAELYQLPVVLTLLGIGSLAYEHQLCMGMGGMHGTYGANMALMECDLLINIGARFDDRLACKPTEFAPHAKIAHIDIDPAEIGKIIPTQIPIVADAKKGIQALLNIDQTLMEDNLTFSDKTEKIAREEQTKEILKSKQDWILLQQKRKQKQPSSYQSTEINQRIKPQRVIEAIGEITKGEAIIVTDVGQHQMWAAQCYPFKYAKQLITSGGLGTMGYGIPAAIGAKLGCPDKTVVLLVGDGGFQMTNQELAILKEYQIDIKVVLLNNHSLGMVRQWQERFFGGRCSQSIFTTQPDFQQLVASYHLPVCKLTQTQDLLKNLANVFTEKGASFVEVEIIENEQVLPMIPVGKANHQMLGVD